ncbi:hypothetical protein [Streptomyces sp. ME19-01-6]|uniref:hypothetical protein n=1 Tax=Streptomyces sp. ME19-01-6 TaxID=3028686 RepID=UPI0029A6FF22|nr:hypothetical protein [Streptomyces sp. ME19-01-6]MDX3232784.1 hypothetical protein [Streptomyces sp. ME19-01-6]
MKACARRRFAARVWPAVVVSVVALGLTGCGGGGGDGDEVASAQGGKRASGAAKGGEGEVARYVEGQRKYAECLRDKGVDVPDPDAKGRIEFGDARELKADPTFRQAQEKCAEYSLPLPEELEKETRPELSAKEIATKKRYAKCMQESGAPDFPDTDDEGYFDEKMWDQTSAGAKRATRTCAHIIGRPANPGKGKG